MHQKKTLFSAMLAALMLTACGGSDDDSAASKASEMADEASAMAKDAAEDTKAAAEDMARSAEETMNDAGDAMQGAMDDASAAVDGAVDDASAAAAEAQAAAEDMADDASEAMDEAAAAASSAMDDASAAAGEAMDAATATAAASVGLATAAMANDDDDPCTLGIEVGDNIAYSTDALSVPASCSDVTLTITHTGQLPAIAMGHNWVLLPSDALDSVAQAATAAGADAGYVPSDDRIVAATGLVGGGESDSVTFSLDSLQEGTDYSFVCTFPGHWAVMKGTFTVSG